MKKLTVGDIAPTFTVQDAFGATVTFNGAGQRATLLAFLRYAACPFCNLAIHRLTVEYPILQDSGIDVIAFVQSSRVNIQKHIYEEHAERPPFPIIPAGRPNVYKQYGVSPTLEQTPQLLATIPAWIHKVRHGGLGEIDVDGNLFLAPALFMVSPAGNIVLAKYVANLYNHELFSEVYDAAAHAVLA